MLQMHVYVGPQTRQIKQGLEREQSCLS